jgi:hypothetical protein
MNVLVIIWVNGLHYSCHRQVLLSLSFQPAAPT